MKNELLASLYRSFRWPSNLEFLHFLESCRDVQDVRETFLFHPLLLHLDRIDLKNMLDAVQTECEIALSKGWNILYPGHENYPTELFHQELPPVYLCMMGFPAWNKVPFISVVGSRDPNMDALEWIETELRAVLRQGIGVVSGAARGIDQAAHACCLQVGQPTIAFLPSGFNHIYPSNFNNLIPNVLSLGGAILTEYLPQVQIQKVHFHERNRLIATLGRLVLVVQARIKSGSLLTARHALLNGKCVAALPWNTRDVGTMGTNQLLFDGAQMVRDHWDLLQLLDLEQ